MPPLGCPHRVPKGWHPSFPQQFQHFSGKLQTPGVSGRMIIDLSAAGASLRSSVRHWGTFPNCIFLFNTTKFSLSVPLHPSGSPSLLPVVLSQHFQGPFWSSCGDYFPVEIQNLGGTDGSDSSWSLHLILMETEQLWAQNSQNLASREYSRTIPALPGEGGMLGVGSNGNRLE